MAAVSPLFAVFPPPQRSEAEWATWWAAYFEDLGFLPLEALKDAVREFRRQGDAEFFPKPGKLRDLATRHAAPVQRALFRCKLALQQPEPREITAEERDQRRQLVAQTLAQLSARQPTTPEKPILPPVRPPLVAGGITPEMAARLQPVEEFAGEPVR